MVLQAQEGTVASDYLWKISMIIKNIRRGKQTTEQWIFFILGTQVFFLLMSTAPDQDPGGYETT